MAGRIASVAFTVQATDSDLARFASVNAYVEWQVGDLLRVGSVLMQADYAPSALLRIGSVLMQVEWEPGGNMLPPWQGTSLDPTYMGTGNVAGQVQGSFAFTPGARRFRHP